MCLIFGKKHYRYQAEFNWHPVLLFKFHELKYNKIKQFNFKLLHRILPSKCNLCKWKVLPETICEICNIPSYNKTYDVGVQGC